MRPLRAGSFHTLSYRIWQDRDASFGENILVINTQGRETKVTEKGRIYVIRRLLTLC